MSKRWMLGLLDENGDLLPQFEPLPFEKGVYNYEWLAKQECTAAYVGLFWGDKPFLQVPLDSKQKIYAGWLMTACCEEFLSILDEAMTTAVEQQTINQRVRYLGGT